MEKVAPVVPNKDVPAPKIDVYSNIRTMPLHQRALFANGSKVQVKMEDDTLATLPSFSPPQLAGTKSIPVAGKKGEDDARVAPGRE
jgi:hypothetical protein